MLKQKKNRSLRKKNKTFYKTFIPLKTQFSNVLKYKIKHYIILSKAMASHELLYCELSKIYFSRDTIKINPIILYRDGSQMVNAFSMLKFLFKFTVGNERLKFLKQK